MPLNHISLDDIKISILRNYNFLSEILPLSKSEVPLISSLQSYLNIIESVNFNPRNWTTQYKYNGLDLRCDLVKTFNIALEAKFCYSYEFTRNYVHNLILMNSIQDIDKLKTDDVFDEFETKYILIFVINFNPNQFIGLRQNRCLEFRYITGIDYLKYNNLEINNGIFRFKRIRCSNLTQNGIDIYNSENNEIINDIDSYILSSAGVHPMRSIGGSYVNFYFTGEIAFNYDLFFFLYQL